MATIEIRDLVKRFGSVESGRSGFPEPERLPRGARSKAKPAERPEHKRLMRGRRSVIAGAAGGLAGLALAGRYATPANASTAGAPAFLTPSGDAKGTTDTAAINALLGAGPGVVLLSPGTYYVQADAIALGPMQYLRGPGKGCCTIQGVSGTGPGPVIQIANSTGSYHPDEYAGISGISVDATGLGAGCPALQVGDIVNLEIGDIAAYANAHSPAFLARNSHYWTEQMHGSLLAAGGGSAPLVQFDVDGGTNSFDRIDMNIWLSPTNSANSGTAPGVAFTNGAVTHWGHLALRGNFTGTAPGLGYVPAVLSFSGATSEGPAGIYRAQLDIQVECDGNGVTGTGPQTVSFIDSAGNHGFIQDCYGLIDMHAYDGAAWITSDNAGCMSFSGPVYGDATLTEKASTADYGKITSGFPAGWSGIIEWRKLADIDLFLVTWSLVISAGTHMANGTNLGILPAPYFFPSDKEMLPGTLLGGESGFAAAQLLLTGEFDYSGPTLTPSATAYWKGQAILSNIVQ